MRRTLVGLAAATLAVTAVPALAADEPALLAPCADVADKDRLTLAGLEESVTAALVPDPSLAAAPLPKAQPDAKRTVVLDLAGQAVGSTASVGGVLTWGQSVNDYDLRLASGDSSAVSQEVNPETMAAREETALGGVEHCATVVVTVRNYLAAPDSLALALTAAVEEPLEDE